MKSVRFGVDTSHPLGSLEDSHTSTVALTGHSWLDSFLTVVREPFEYRHLAFDDLNDIFLWWSELRPLIQDKKDSVERASIYFHFYYTISLPVQAPFAA